MDEQFRRFQSEDAHSFGQQILKFHAAEKKKQEWDEDMERRVSAILAKLDFSMVKIPLPDR